MEVLTAFVREHSREQWLAAESPDTTPPERRTWPDVQAAVTVIGRRNRQQTSNSNTSTLGTRISPTRT